MEWVETTAKSIESAQDRALDQLGVAADEAEFEVLEEPRSGLFGRVRGEARVRARVKPAAVRPKQERRQRGRNQQRDGKKSRNNRSSKQSNGDRSEGSSSKDSASGGNRSSSKSDRPATSSSGAKQSRQNKEKKRMDQDQPESQVTPQEVGDAAVGFMSKLTEAFGVTDANTELTVDGTELEVRVTGSELGLMVGPGGRTLTAVQDLVRVASQRRLGDHDTRLRIDVGDYRRKRHAALETFAGTVAAKVLETGEPKALEPMTSSDRKAVHDAVIEIEGVSSHSEGDDPMRRVVITPA